MRILGTKLLHFQFIFFSSFRRWGGSLFSQEGQSMAKHWEMVRVLFFSDKQNAARSLTCPLTVAVSCLDLNVSPKEPLGMKLPFLVLMCANTGTSFQDHCELWTFLWGESYQSGIQQNVVERPCSILLSYKESCWQAIHQKSEDLSKKKKKKSILQLSCLWPICFAHRDKRFIHDLALLMSLEKSLLCAEWSVSLSSFSMKCKAVSSNIGCSDSFPLGRLFLWLLMELYLKNSHSTFLNHFHDFLLSRLSAIPPSEEFLPALLGSRVCVCPSSLLRAQSSARTPPSSSPPP